MCLVTKPLLRVMPVHFGRCHGDTGAEEGTAALDRGTEWVEACLDGMELCPPVQGVGLWREFREEVGKKV